MGERLGEHGRLARERAAKGYAALRHKACLRRLQRAEKWWLCFWEAAEAALVAERERGS